MIGKWKDVSATIMVRSRYGVLTFYISQHEGDDNVGLKNITECIRIQRYIE